MEEILAVHGDGIAAIAEIAGRLDDDAWDRQTPCDGWTAQDLAGHVVTVSTMWHEALDDAEAGVTTARWRWKDMARHNDEYLASLPPASGPQRIVSFIDQANRWCERVAAVDPDLPIPVAVQDLCAIPLTVRLFAWVAGGEWHVHAWDFAQVIGESYRTAHAHIITQARAAMFGAPLADGDPWAEIIRQSRS